MRTLVWFRSDLRVDDHPALHHACRESSRGVVALFLVSPEQWRRHDWAPVRMHFVLRTLAELSASLRRLRIPLLVRTADEFADAPDEILDVMRRHECDTLVYNREYEVNEATRDRRVTEALEREGLDVRAFTDQVILPPGGVRTGKGDFYTVFTPFKRAWIARIESGGVPVPASKPKPCVEMIVEPSAVPKKIAGVPAPESVDLWRAGEAEAQRRLRNFVRRRIDDYDANRDIPSVDGTSALSPYLAVGAISPRRCLHAAWRANGETLHGDGGAAVWISELIWREFYRHVLVGFPRVCKHRPFKEDTDRIRWRKSEKDFDAWREGRTGYPIVDAAMRQLRETGWMHNRLRMIAAMFLSKHLLLDWRWGERHFMQSLVDGDLASNNGGWQWSASTGTDAAPYFRIFNPFSQSRKCDPEGTFIRQYVPELAHLDAKAIHDPSELDVDYPKPIVDHGKARERALAAFKGL